MKFLLDENLSPRWERPLQAVFEVHRFVSVNSLGLRGTDDEDLFPAVAQQDVDAILTGDVHQMERENERRAILTAGLSWIGIESRNVPGRTGPLLQLATLISGLALLDSVWRDEPWAYQLHHVGQNVASRVHDFDLWDEGWGPKG